MRPDAYLLVVHLAAQLHRPGIAPRYLVPIRAALYVSPPVSNVAVGVANVRSIESLWGGGYGQQHRYYRVFCNKRRRRRTGDEYLGGAR